MGKYDSAAQTALSLIKRKGGTAVVTRRTEGSFDPVTQQSTPTEQTESFPAIGLPPGRSAAFVLGELIHKDVIEFYFSQKGQTLTPKPGDSVVWGGNAYRIEWSDTFDPASDGAILTKAYGVR